MEKLGPTLTKSQFYRYELVIFSYESLLEYEMNLKKKLFQTLYYILQMLFSSARFFWGIKYDKKISAALAKALSGVQS